MSCRGTPVKGEWYTVALLVAAVPEAFHDPVGTSTS